MSRYFRSENIRRRRLPSGRKRKPAGRPKRISQEHEEKVFLAVNLLWGEPEVGKGVDELRRSFRNSPAFVLKIRNVKPWLLHSERGREFMALVMRHGYAQPNVFNLYRRYANWYFRQEVNRADQATP